MDKRIFASVKLVLAKFRPCVKQHVTSFYYFIIALFANNTKSPVIIIKLAMQTQMSFRFTMAVFCLLPQVLHNMSMWTAKEKSLNYDQAKKEAAKAQKDIKMVSSPRLQVKHNGNEIIIFFWKYASNDCMIKLTRQQ